MSMKSTENQRDELIRLLSTVLGKINDLVKDDAPVSDIEADGIEWDDDFETILKIDPSACSEYDFDHYTT